MLELMGPLLLFGAASAATFAVLRLLGLQHPRARNVVELAMILFLARYPNHTDREAGEKYFRVSIITFWTAVVLIVAAIRVVETFFS
jgi:hypothetical protein